MFKSDENLGIPKSVIEEMAKTLEEMKKMTKEQTHPKTEKEKKLAALAEPKDKITHKDVLVGRGVVKEMSSKEKMKRGFYNKEEVELDEKHLTPAEMKKREEIAKAMERDNPGMDKSKKMAIATSTAKKVAEEAEQLDEIGDTPAGKKALGNYINKAAGKLHKSSYMIAKDKPENANKHGNDAYNRRVGILRATSKLTKEDINVEDFIEYHLEEGYDINDIVSYLEENYQLDEVSKKTAFAAYAGKANDDYSKDYGEKLHGMIKKKWGKKAGDDAEAHASAQHFGRGGKSLGRDKLSTWNTPASSMRTTKSGKIHKQDTKAKASEIKSRLGTHKKAKLPEEIDLEDFINYHLEEGYEIDDIVNYLEENYQLDEVLDTTFKKLAYGWKAEKSRDAARKDYDDNMKVGGKPKRSMGDNHRIIYNRGLGMSRVMRKLKKEDVDQVDEALTRKMGFQKAERSRALIKPGHTGSFTKGYTPKGQSKADMKASTDAPYKAALKARGMKEDVLSAEELARLDEIAKNLD